jgi:hypothetical protein
LPVAMRLDRSPLAFVDSQRRSHQMQFRLTNGSAVDSLHPLSLSLSHIFSRKTFTYILTFLIGLAQLLLYQRNYHCKHHDQNEEPFNDHLVLSLSRCRKGRGTTERTSSSKDTRTHKPATWRA